MATEINSLTSSKAINAGRMMVCSAEVHMFGCVGAGLDGERAISDLKNYRIKPTYVTSTSKAKTGEVVVMTDLSGDSAFTVFMGANLYSDINVIKNISQFNYIYTASSMDLKKLYKLISFALKSKVRIFLDFPNQQREFDRKYLKNIGFVVPNRHEAELLLGVRIKVINDALSAVKKLKKFTSGNAVITLDKDGAVFMGAESTEAKHIPTKKVNTVDTTASGDILRGVLLSEYLKSNNLEAAIRKAVEIATKSCEIKGVDNSILFCQKLV